MNFEGFVSEFGAEIGGMLKNAPAQFDDHRAPVGVRGAEQGDIGAGGCLGLNRGTVNGGRGNAIAARPQPAP